MRLACRSSAVTLGGVARDAMALTRERAHSVDTKEEEPDVPKKGKPISGQLSDVTYLSAVKIPNAQLARQRSSAYGTWHCEMTSLDEGRAIKLAKESRDVLARFNASQLTRVYPAGIRVYSDNMKAQHLASVWAAGCQMVALNFQVVPIAWHGGW
jgi:hypothetical protein